MAIINARGLAGVMVAVAATVLHPGAHGALAAATDADSKGDKRSAGKTRARVAAPKAVPPKPLWVACADALADGSIVDSRQAVEIGALAANLKWDGGYGVPGDCHRAVRLFCGPDLDRDGDPEAIVQVNWWSATDGDACESLRDATDHAIVIYTFLASKHLTVWRAVAPVGVAVDADGSAARPSAYFIRRSRGDLAVRTEWSSVSSDSGCRIGGYEVFALRAGALRKLEAGDSSFACIMCDCDQP